MDRRRNMRRNRLDTAAPPPQRAHIPEDNMNETKLLWKSMKPGLKSAHGEINWKLGEWQKCDEQLSLCAHGFHASENVLDAMGFVRAAIIARVEVSGDHIDESDKQCWSEMRIIEAKEWTKADSVALAILAARLVLADLGEAAPGRQKSAKCHRDRRAVRPR